MIPPPVRPMVEADLAWMKPMADRHRAELGFLWRPVLRTGTVVVVEGFGFVRFYRRRDGWHTVYDLVAEPRGVGTGRRLLEAVPRPRRLRCPEDLEANGFYRHLGGALVGVVTGRRRNLCVWEWT